MVKCEKCGKENTSDAVRCKHCGEPINNNKSSSNTKLIAIIAVIVIIAIIGVFASGMFSNNTTSQNDAQVLSPQQPQSTVQNNTTSNVNNTADSSNSQPSTYVASAKTDKFHRPDCEWAQKISDSNKITYSSRDMAIADGKVPCSVCNP